MLICPGEHSYGESHHFLFVIEERGDQQMHNVNADDKREARSRVSMGCSVDVCASDLSRVSYIMTLVVPARPPCLVVLVTIIIVVAVSHYCHSCLLCPPIEALERHAHLPSTADGLRS